MQLHHSRKPHGVGGRRTHGASRCRGEKDDLNRKGLLKAVIVHVGVQDVVDLDFFFFNLAGGDGVAGYFPVQIIYKFNMPIATIRQGCC